MVRLEDLIWVIFQELDPLELKAMWDADRETKDSMIEIIYVLYFIKIRPWLCDVILWRLVLSCNV
jgi:hypothetical protein